jgi:drug/metabolite transporter (DMT)-like permease
LPSPAFWRQSGNGHGEADIQISSIVQAFLVAVLLAVGQLLFKIAADRQPHSGAVELVRSLLLDPVFYLALGIYGFATLAWLYVLSTVKLSLAYPFLALAFLLTPIGAWLFLGEPIGARYSVGLVLLLAGLVVISSSQGN